VLYGEGAEEEIHDEAGGKHPAHCGSQRDFRVEWQPTQNRRGAGIEGYVYNTSNRTAQRVSLRIERVELPIDGSRVLQRVRPHRGQLPCPGSLVRLVVSGRWRRRDVAERRPIRLNATTSSR